MGGSLWLAAGSGVEQALRFLRNIILARVLVPEIFGTVAIVFAVSSLLDAFTQVGLREFVIQNPRSEDPLLLNGAWWFSFLRGIVLYGLAFFTAPWIAAFYGNPSLVPLLRVSFLGLFFKAAMSTRAYLLVKRMEFKRWILIEQLGGSIGVVCAILLSLVFHNAWGLVIGFTVEAVAMGVLSYLVCPFLPRWKFDPAFQKQLLVFARGMFGIPIFIYLFLNVDVFVIGKLRTVAELGLYAMAVSLAQIPMLLMDKVISPLFMPAFSEMQSDPQRLGRAVRLATSMFGFVFIPGLIFVALYSGQILEVVYGSAYAAVAVPFIVMFAMVIVRAMQTPINAVYLSLGQPRKLRFFTMLRAVLLLVLIYPGVRYLGLLGAALAALVSISAIYILQIARVRSMIDLRLESFWISLLPSVPVTTLLLVVWALSRHFLSLAPLLDVAIGIGGLLGVYLVLGVLVVKSPRLRTFSGLV